MLFTWKRKAAFTYPVAGLRGASLPTAVLGPWVRQNGAVRVFLKGWNSEAAQFAPAAIAGSWLELERLLPVKIPSVTHAVIVLARKPAQLLTQAQRERLWDAFHVPVFEQILAEDGAVLASECEAHNGLHVVSPKLEIGASCLDRTPCGCGQSSARLRLNTIPTELDAMRAIAAYAR